jgi:hypothetical protein
MGHAPSRGRHQRGILSPTLVFPARVIESMTTGEPVVRVLAVLAVPLDVGLVGGGWHEPQLGRQLTQPVHIDHRGTLFIVNPSSLRYWGSS